MRGETSVAGLLDRFHQDLNQVMYPFLIASVIARNGAATSEEIAEQIFALTEGTFACEPASHRRQIGRMDKTFGLIESSGRKKSAAEVKYRLTEKGERLYSETVQRLIRPLVGILPRT